MDRDRGRESEKRLHKKEGYREGTVGQWMNSAGKGEI